MPAEFIYQTYRLARHYPPDRTVLEDISLSFYPGAKIGVIGPNGAGKSSLLKIMAGLDDGFTGEARLTPGAKARPDNEAGNRCSGTPCPHHGLRTTTRVASEPHLTKIYDKPRQVGRHHGS